MLKPFDYILDSDDNFGLYPITMIQKFTAKLYTIAILLVQNLTLLLGKGIEKIQA